METSPSWSVRDHFCNFHPFTFALSDSLAIVRGEKTLLFAEDGKAYIDAISSWWVNLHGHVHPYIIEKIHAQSCTLEHVLFAGYTHPQAVLLAERLLSLFHGNFSKVFYSDNGSTAIEVAIKLSFEYFGAKKTLVSFKGGYHGDTFGAMSAAGKNHFTAPFWPYLFDVHTISPPTKGNEEASFEQFQKAIKEEDVGAFIFEPLIQGAGGMRLHSQEVLAKMIALAKKEGIITIADEVMTGFGRTGPLFACEHLGILPDILCLSKGLTGGFLPLGATLIHERMCAPYEKKIFLHGHSYTANPLACAAANASLDLLITPECSKARQEIHKQHLDFQKTYANYPGVIRCDVLGTILAVEYAGDSKKEQIKKLFQEAGIIVRPLGNILYCIPPYCITQEELESIYETMYLI
jgi:adenosylmethionine-8-amino-7-oxononanoate aminotransferase